MKKVYFTSALLLATLIVKAQTLTGVGTQTPKAALHIEPQNAVTPKSSAGLGIPVLDRFPAINPTNDQNAMLIFLRNTTDSNLEGFYYWDAATNSWEYIVDFKTIGLDTSKTIVSGNAFTPNNITGTGTDSRFIPLTIINSLDPSFSLTTNGGLKVGKTAKYYLIFTGGIYKTASNQASQYTTDILINGTVGTLTSVDSAPGGSIDGRSATFYIAAIVNLTKDDVLTIRTTRGSTTIPNTVSVNTPYTLTMINLD
ncbi:hypothetical protein [Paenimyroides aestuarii]|uniref:Uncharacterized protein n=1 Tax=Paenimyroides aestuarii TaxID=2968490 RepID=A0ABY5NPR7_9FLAO|nr:hypothetical protein [Paenimyroides aestuarii]UUV20488.1 hypothetical protein NPX36_08925 [Paenimyroides aestuarii]